MWDSADAVGPRQRDPGCRLQQVGQLWSGIPHIKGAVAKASGAFRCAAPVSAALQLPRMVFGHFTEPAPVPVPDPCTSASRHEFILLCVQLSDECRDLLDHIFTINEQQRISIQGIKDHAWYNKPLLPKYQAAQDSLRERQAGLTRRMQQRVLNPVWILPRNSALPDMLGCPTDLHFSMPCMRARLSCGALLALGRQLHPARVWHPSRGIMSSAPQEPSLLQAGCLVHQSILLHWTW